MTEATADLAELEPDELKTQLSALGAEPFHARQLYRWIHNRGLERVEGMTDLSRPLREQLRQTFTFSTPQIAAREVSTDGTEKFLFTLTDGMTIESVFIPDTPSMTFCISTQAGCAMRCGFCLTGRMGLVRHLTAGEIAGQVRVLARELHLQNHRFNLVFMGMGEPLHNYDATMKALRMLSAEDGLAVTPKRVTLSTIGIMPAFKRLASERWLPNLAVSLHATTDEIRHALIPTSRNQRLTDLIDVCRRFPIKHRDRITFEYVLLKDVNDTTADATRLAELLQGLRAKVNLIPLNEARGIPFSRPSDQQVNHFARTVASNGLVVSVRKSRGRDIRAACGQLIIEGVSHRSNAQSSADEGNE